MKRSFYCLLILTCIFFISMPVFSEDQTPLPNLKGFAPLRKKPPVEETPEYAHSRPHAGKHDELTITASKGEVELDFRKSYLASEAQLYTAIYEGLFSYDPVTVEPISAVVDKWELSEDKKQWTFNLKEDARYWNGDPVRAGDFRAAWLSILSPDADAPYSSLLDIIEGAREYRTGALKNADSVGIIVKSEKTLVVKLKAPASFFPAMLCHHSFGPVHPEMLNAKDWRELTISNGPYRIGEIDENKIVLLKTENYWDAENVALNKITIKYTENGEEASELWNSGEARWISGEVNIQALTDRSGINVNAMFATHYYYFRGGTEPWNDSRVRRALILALPWDEIRSGYYLPAKTLVYPLPGYPRLEGLSETKIEEALKLLSEAGFPEGKGLPEPVIRITSSQEAMRVAGLMAEAWKYELGVTAKIEIVPFGNYLQALKTEGYQIAFSTWIGDFADPLAFLQMWRRDSNLNDAFFNNDDFENLMEKSMYEEGEARWKTLAEAEKLLLDSGSVIPVSFSPALNIIDTGELGGWYTNALDIHPFKYIHFKGYMPMPGVVLVK